MPSAGDVDAAYPRCPKRIGSVPTLQHVCNARLVSDGAAEVWVCSVHGAVMSWRVAADRLARLLGRMFFDAEAA